MFGHAINTVSSVVIEIGTSNIGGLPLSVSELISVILVLWGASAFFREGYYKKDEDVSYEDIGQVILTFGWLLYVLENTASLQNEAFWEAVGLYTFFYLVATVIGVKLCVFLGEFTRTVQDGGLKKQPSDKPAYNSLDTVFPSKNSRQKKRFAFISRTKSRFKQGNETNTEQQKTYKTDFDETGLSNDELEDLFNNSQNSN